MLRKLYTTLLWIQGIYTLVTAIWGLVDIDSFMKVTGPKADIWLVKTVSTILCAIGVAMIVESVKKTYSISLVILILLNSIGLAAIDFYYAGNDVIWDVYQLDGLAQIVFITLWLIIVFTWRKVSTHS
jgi:hypothetical protein